MMTVDTALSGNIANSLHKSWRRPSIFYLAPHHSA